jgi:hypothetical protein
LKEEEFTAEGRSRCDGRWHPSEVTMKREVMKWMDGKRGRNILIVSLDTTRGTLAHALRKRDVSSN